MRGYNTFSLNSKDKAESEEICCCAQDELQGANEKDCPGHSVGFEHELLQFTQNTGLPLHGNTFHVCPLHFAEYLTPICRFETREATIFASEHVAVMFVCWFVVDVINVALTCEKYK